MVLLNISQNLQENTCVSVSFFNKVAGLRPAALLKKEALILVFSFEFCNIFKKTFSTEHLGRLLLDKELKRLWRDKILIQ